MERLPEFVANHLILVTLFIAILSMLLWNLFGNAMTGIKQVSTAELTRLVNHENAIVVDVRTEDDYKAGHIINAVNHPAAGLEAALKQLEKYRDKPVVLYCNHGNDSVKAVRILQQNGYSRVFALHGGFTSWQSGNLPVLKDNA